MEVSIIWDYTSPRGDKWTEWIENGRTHMRRVTEEFYQELLKRATIAVKPKKEDEWDFLN